MAMEDGQPGRAERRRADTPDDHAINWGVTEWYSPAVAKKPSSAITPPPDNNGQREGILTDAILKLLEESNVPRHAWKKVGAEIALVLKVAVETGGKATVIRPGYLKRAFELASSDLEGGMVARTQAELTSRATQHPLAAAIEMMTLKERYATLAAHYHALTGAETKPWAEARSGKPSHQEFLAWLDKRYPDRREVGLLFSDLLHLDKPAYTKLCQWAFAGVAKATLESFDLPSKITRYDPVRDADAPKSLRELWTRAERGESIKHLRRAYDRVAHHRP
jgi:hypothetical protein